MRAKIEQMQSGGLASLLEIMSHTSSCRTGSLKLNASTKGELTIHHPLHCHDSVVAVSNACDQSDSPARTASVILPPTTVLFDCFFPPSQFYLLFAPVVN